jgi:hypothetical protein
MKIKKGGYAVKNGFYIKNDINNDCKNNDEDGSLDEDGYILDPLTYDRIKEGNLIQLSDGICYEKSKNLATAIKNRNTLPFGQAVTTEDKHKLLLPHNLKPIKRLIIESSTESEDEIIPAPRRIPIRPGSRNRTTRQTPVLIIESDSAEEIGNSGRGTKKRKLKRKTKIKSKRKSKGKTKRKY